MIFFYYNVFFKKSRDFKKVVIFENNVIDHVNNTRYKGQGLQRSHVNSAWDPRVITWTTHDR